MGPWEDPGEEKFRTMGDVQDVHLPSFTPFNM